jgi:signal transduction histidine kinase
VSAATTDRAPRVRWPWVVIALATVIASFGLCFIWLEGGSLTGDIANFIAFMSMGVVGALILSRDRRNVIGGLMLFAVLTIAVAFATNEWSGYLYERGSMTLAGWVAWPGTTLWLLGFFPLLVFLPLLFPDGKLPTPRWRPLAWAGIAFPLLGFFMAGFADDTVAVGVTAPSGQDVEIANPLHVPALAPVAGPLLGALWIGLLGLFVLSIVAMVLRFRRSTGIERQQLRWFSFAATFLAVYFIFSSILESAGYTEGTLGSIISSLGYLSLVVAIGVAILQYHLWDLDVVVKKTLVAGSLVVLVVLVYAAAVALFPSVVDIENPALLFVIALGLGIAFRPVMRVGRRLADRIVYGSRATPYEILSEFSERVGTSYATEDVLPRMAQVLGEGTGGDVARIWLRVGTTFQPAAVWPAASDPVIPESDGDDLVVPGEHVTQVRDQGDVLGALSVRMPASDPMNPTKEKLVHDLAAQAGLVLRNVRLVEDLRASRQRLVAAQDEERRRLERNIHDGAQQQLVALAVKARLARQFTERDPAKATDLLGQIEAETQTALEDLRDLARGIYPPLLADAGLVAAIEAQSRKGQHGVEVDADGVGRFPADIEATVYFCALEALQNVAKYAEAAHTVVHLSRANGDLSFEVVDDGRGFDPAHATSGSGLQGMADRLAAVGGSLEVRSAPGRGTTVAGRVPVGADGSSD